MANEPFYQNWYFVLLLSSVLFLFPHQNWYFRCWKLWFWIQFLWVFWFCLSFSAIWTHAIWYAFYQWSQIFNWHSVANRFGFTYQLWFRLLLFCIINIDETRCKKYHKKLSFYHFYWMRRRRRGKKEPICIHRLLWFYFDNDRPKMEKQQ